MTAYIARNHDGSIAQGWILKSGTSINAPMCRSPYQPEILEHIEEVSVEIALLGAAGVNAEQTERDVRARPNARKE